MRDVDAAAAHEAKQQELIEKIMRSLRGAADKFENNDRLAVLRSLATDLLEELCGPRGSTYVARLPRWMIPRLVNGPIIEFIGNEKLEERYAEFKYLQLRVFEEIRGALASHIISDYLALKHGQPQNRAGHLGTAAE
jgi:hypothetical protein